MDHEITAEIPVVRPPARRPGPPRRTGTPRWLLRAFVAAAVLIVLLGAADLALLVSRQHGARHAGGHEAAPTTVPGAIPLAPTTTAAPTTSAPPVTASTTTTTVAPPSGAGPVLTSISPAAGGPGTVVVLHGRGFFSPASGVVVAHVDGVGAPTDCPAQTSCQVTIPQLPGQPSAVTVTVTTDAGTSDALPFRYS